VSRILDRIESPADLRALSLDELKTLAQEVREELVATTAQTGGHLASNLGVVELTLALHRVFDSPRDKIVWDVSHQIYVQKLITGRRARFDTIRTLGGLSGFADREESVHDQFGAGHAGTAISAALGMAIARERTGASYNVAAVLGDGALTAGMAMEALNHAGGLRAGMLVILNDNGMSISPNVGALAQTINRVRMDPLYQGVNRMGERLLDHMPAGHRLLKLGMKLKSRARATLYQPAWFFEHFGFEYFGPVDGHDLDELVLALDGIKDYLDRPVLLHVLTQKGHGYQPAEADPIKLHGVSPAGTKKAAAPTYSQVMADTCTKLIEQDSRVVAITAAMLEGTGLISTLRKHPDRVYDVGICEQHGVTFALDRAGFVGDDGKTHQGAFDIAYLRCLPNMVLAAPKDENELQHLLYTGVQSGGPFAVRYPRGAGYGVPMDKDLHEIPIGKAELLRDGDDIVILAYGAPVIAALDAAERLADSGIQAAVVNARYAKPLDETLILDLCARARAVLTLEEHVLAGGFGAAVIELLAAHGLRLPVVTRTMPDVHVDHGPQAHFRAVHGLDADGITAAARTLFDQAIDLPLASLPRP